MKSNTVWGLVSATFLLAGSAEAHFKLEQPADSVVTDNAGNPQKPSSPTDRCPAGTATGMVTQVQAGGKVHVKVNEGTVHGGHYRVSFAANRASFVLPNTTVTGNQCMSTTIQASPVLPVLADGLFPHADVGGPRVYETDVTVPNVAPGNYTLQIFQWMTPHASAPMNGIHGCFYIHCANLMVVAPTDGGTTTTDGGGVVDGATSDSAQPPVDLGDGTPDSDGSASGGDDGGGGGGDDAGGGVGGGGGAPSTGCSLGAGAGASLVPGLLSAMGVLLLLRRRRKT